MPGEDSDPELTPLDDSPRKPEIFPDKNPVSAEENSEAGSSAGVPRNLQAGGPVEEMGNGKREKRKRDRSGSTRKALEGGDEESAANYDIVKVQIDKPANGANGDGRSRLHNDHCNDCVFVQVYPSLTMHICFSISTAGYIYECAHCEKQIPVKHITTAEEPTLTTPNSEAEKTQQSLAAEDDDVFKPPLTPPGSTNAPSITSRTRSRSRSNDADKPSTSSPHKDTAESISTKCPLCNEDFTKQKPHSSTMQHQRRKDKDLSSPPSKRQHTSSDVSKRQAERRRNASGESSGSKASDVSKSSSSASKTSSSRRQSTRLTPRSVSKESGDKASDAAEDSSLNGDKEDSEEEAESTPARTLRSRKSSSTTESSIPSTSRSTPTPSRKRTRIK